MARTPTFTGLTVDAIRAEDQGAWLFCVNVDGAQVVIGSRKLGGIDSDIESARLAAEKAAVLPTPPAQAASPETPSPTQ